ncbi:hypothetical protein IWW36_004103, partial [Coemansia brasiliensis]
MSAPVDICYFLEFVLGELESFSSLLSITSMDIQLVALRSQTCRQSLRQTTDALKEFLPRLTLQLPNIQNLWTGNYREDMVVRSFITRLVSHYAKQLYSLYPISVVCPRKPTSFQQLSSLSVSFNEPALESSLRVYGKNLVCLHMSEVPETLDWQLIFNPNKLGPIVFRKLRQLTICHNVWSIWQGDDEEEHEMAQLMFPCLETLHFIHCPQGFLFFKHIKMPTVLKRLTIQHNLSALCMYNIYISQQLKCHIASLYDAAKENASFVKIANLLLKISQPDNINFTYSSLTDDPYNKIDLGGIDWGVSLDTLDINFKLDWQQLSCLLNRLPYLRRLTIRCFECNDNGDECNCIDLGDMLDHHM